MRERLMNMLGPMARAIWILTFHSACGRILRSEAERLGLQVELHDLRLAPTRCASSSSASRSSRRIPKRFVPRGVHAQISNAKNQLVTPAMYAERISSFYDQTVAEVYELYQRRSPPRTRSTSTTC